MKVPIVLLQQEVMEGSFYFSVKMFSNQLYCNAIIYAAKAN